MIALRCNSCGQEQELDDAFIGSVCRCRACAAIQAVPEAPAPIDPSRKLAAPVMEGTLLYCPTPAGERHNRPRTCALPQRKPAVSADRTLIMAISLAAVLAMGAAGAAIAVIVAAERPMPQESVPHMTGDVLARSVDGP